MKCYYITDWRREGDGFGEYIRLPESEGKKIKVFHSMPVAVDPEITEPVDWFLEVYIPFSVIENNVGSLGNIEKSRWRANFYKCGDETSHPHWASWSPVDELNFHLPRCFGTLAFE